MNPVTHQIWHIFRKDVKLLWPFVLASAGLQVTSAILLYGLAHFVLSRTVGAYLG